MPAPSKELIAVAHIGFCNNEAALKQHAIMFGRIAIQGLGHVLRTTQFVTPEFARNRAMLAESGVLFEPDMQKLMTPDDDAYRNSVRYVMTDFDEVLRPLGVSMAEMVAARNDKEKAAQIKQKTSQPASVYEANISDPQKLIDTERRLTVNLMRLLAFQIRKIEGLDACVTISSEDNSLDQADPRPEQHDVMKFSLVLPVPDDSVSWDEILEYRNDPDFPNRFFELREWMSDVACGSLTGVEAGEKLEVLLDRYRRLLQAHQMQINWTRMEAYVVTTSDVLKDLDAMSQRGSMLFSVEGRRLALLEGELTAAGSVVGFVIQGKSMLAL